MSWQHDAACRDTDPDLFFPASSDDTSAVVRAHLAAARRICALCPVTTACLSWALATRQNHGLWAATTPTDRRALRRTTQPR